MVNFRLMWSIKEMEILPLCPQISAPPPPHVMFVLGEDKRGPKIQAFCCFVSSYSTVVPKDGPGISSGTPGAFVRNAVSWTRQNQNLWGGAPSICVSASSPGGSENHRVVFVVGPTWRSPGEPYLPSRRTSLSSSLVALMQPPPLLPNVGSDTSGNKSQKVSTQTNLNPRRN